jgi:ubiquinone biosynthesis protein UbiJ
MVGQGIAFNVEQRALLQEMSGKIATTFEAANGTLLRLVKIQQQDTTAGRLGMESALTAFLNNMYSTTEYMQSLATSVKSSLEEAMSLMTGENALSFEYQIQK